MISERSTPTLQINGLAEAKSTPLHCNGAEAVGVPLLAELSFVSPLSLGCMLSVSLEAKRPLAFLRNVFNPATDMEDGNDPEFFLRTDGEAAEEELTADGGGGGDGGGGEERFICGFGGQEVRAEDEGLFEGEGGAELLCSGE